MHEMKYEMMGFKDKIFCDLVCEVNLLPKARELLVNLKENKHYAIALLHTGFFFSFFFVCFFVFSFIF